eukprot:CAMPEP_0176390904 /NCGR_PEP_ID=MMETSP0126-20121128/39583_1 /TAXON_ID=141414 ORGANISM="Strombidinopsis acuminatum, Strain SPMC142" /NCGR_SAMPLE_ID=MMETSP0126 /ASSEMBLY_ACC=CAM_ASM_000229 /LENGTH=40 /DNA_ID= /DNA_START= /DNA_END= /DNA_ORIENTATION=
MNMKENKTEVEILGHMVNGTMGRNQLADHQPKPKRPVSAA